jgi:hypothetical protein
MCCLCDGWTLDEAQADLNDRKQRFGWALQGVEGARPWVYSIGLTERCGHPELVMAGVPIDAAMAVINALGHRIEAGEDLVDGQRVREGEVELEVGTVHPVHIATGLVGQWKEHYLRHPEVAPLEPALLQVMPCPVVERFRLSRPHVRLG